MQFSWTEMLRHMGAPAIAVATAAPAGPEVPLVSFTG